MEAINKVNSKLYLWFARLLSAGCIGFEFIGGRRSGKTWFVCQFLLTRVLRYGETVNVATMTAEQGRLGAYADMQAIIADSPSIAIWLDVLSSPREIRCKFNGGRVFFNSYQNSETAKGVACDWLFMNECNNFSYQHYVDLAANVRKGIIVDHNPTKKRFWVDDVFKPEQVIHSTWQDNEYLPETQKQYFHMLKERNDSPDATAMDRYLYEVNYLGKYSDEVGSIFTPANLQQVESVPDGLANWTVFCDPSALRGSDYFAAVLAATDGEFVYFVDAFSINKGDYSVVANLLRQWLGAYDVKHLYVESNGEIGQVWCEYLENSRLPVEWWFTKGSKHGGRKFDRIVANYHNLTERCRYALPDEYLQQVYSFAENCEHDDNVDALNSCWNSFVYDGWIKI